MSLGRETKKLCAPMIKEEEVSKYRCKECSKLFKAPEFVMKHVVVKHGEGIKGRLDEVSLIFAVSRLVEMQASSRLSLGEADIETMTRRLWY